MSADRDRDETDRMDLVLVIEKDLKLLDDYRANELFRIDRLFKSMRKLGALDQRLGGGGYDA